MNGDEMVARATAMRDVLRADAEATELRGVYSPEIHEAFTEAGFYRALQPRRYGGYELGLDDYFRLVIELSRADPSTGWAFCLGAAHVFQFAAFFGEQAQDEVFGGDGHVVIPSRNIPRGTARPVEGGYVVSGTWDYASGSAYSTHFMALALDGDRRVIVIVPRQDYTILDDWGGGRTIGLGGTASNSITIEEVFVPDHRANVYDWKDYELKPEGTPGTRLHGNPMYLARSLTLFYGELTAIMVGAARAMLDEYESLMRERPTSFPPPIPRLDAVQYQQWFGEALATVDTAEAATIGTAERYMDLCRRWGATGEPFDVITDARMRDVMAVAARMATEAIDLMFRTGGSTAARTGSRLLRYYRDASMFRTHIAAQHEVVHASTARAYFGGPLTH